MELEHYAIDAAMSTITVRPFAGGTLSAVAQNPTLTIRDLAGEACFIPGTLDGASVQIKIKAASLAFAEELSNEERKQIEHAIHRDILETDKYPDIVFSTSKVSASKAGDGQYWVNLLANVSLHGVTASEPVAAQLVLAGDTLFVRGELTVVHAAYNIRPGALPGGALRLKDEVKCLFDIVARKQPEQATEGNKRMLAVEGS
ncbi:MAG TPA: YceI family protein [Bryobacteraceae bacterium]|jgi:polyisoprenoid-binding protein YceI|nr:YceI family protein [Bryobacteraceae bacterium]